MELSGAQEAEKDAEISPCSEALSTCKTDRKIMNFNFKKLFEIQMSFPTLKDGPNTIDTLFHWF